MLHFGWQGLGAMPGKVIKGKGKYIHADGRTDVADIQISFSDRDNYVYTVLNRSTNGQKLSDIKIIGQRKAE